MTTTLSLWIFMLKGQAFMAFLPLSQSWVLFLTPNRQTQAHSPPPSLSVHTPKGTITGLHYILPMQFSRTTAVSASRPELEVLEFNPCKYFRPPSMKPKCFLYWSDCKIILRREKRVFNILAHINRIFFYILQAWNSTFLKFESSSEPSEKQPKTWCVL